jgi:DNA-binding GntR family transcriptional regulator
MSQEVPFVEDRRVRLSLRQKAYDAIKREIITCRLSPGESISELQFVERFQVSKTPIREALTALQKDGLVHYIPNRGFTVAPITIRDVQEIFEAREFFETTLFRLAMANLSDASIAILDGFSKVEFDINSPAAVDVLLQANENFHLEIARLAGNSRLLDYYRNLLNEAQRLIYLDFKNSNISRAWHTSHHELMDSIRNRDVESGVRYIRETLNKAKRRILGTE